MAKSVFIYGVFLWLVLGFYDYAGGGVVEGRDSRYETRSFDMGDEGNVKRETQIRDDLQKIFRNELGTREATGKNDGERIESYLRVTGLGKGYAYCASFVSFCFSEAGFPEPRTAWSPALFPKSRIIFPASHVSWNEVRVPQPGDVFGLYFPDLKRIAHAGFVDEWGDKLIITVEGNTNLAGSNEGDGVYRKRRLKSSIHQVADWICGQERFSKNVERVPK